MFVVLGIPGVYLEPSLKEECIDIAGPDLVTNEFEAFACVAYQDGAVFAVMHTD